VFADSRCCGSGRFRVRAIKQSMSRSSHMLSVFADPTISAVPRISHTTRPAGTPPGARLIAPAHVRSAIIMMRGLTSAMRSTAL